jgi:hypothetical protein
MQVIQQRGRKELISRSLRNLKELETEYRKLGAKTQMTLKDPCNARWSLTVTDQGHESRYFDRMGERYNP